jgi:hypothetical protein
MEFRTLWALVPSTVLFLLFLYAVYCAVSMSRAERRARAAGQPRARFTAATCRRAERVEKLERLEKPQRFEKPERAERPQRAERAERFERPGRRS